MPEPRHPSPETLLAYHERSLPEADVERVRDHLADCPECASVILDLESFPDLEPPTEEHRLSPADLRRQWADIERRIAERPPWWQRHQVLLPIAASLLVAAVGLGIWGQNAGSRLRPPEHPNGDVWLVEPRRVEGGARGAGGAEAIPTGVEQLVVVLDLGATESFPSYSLDIRSSDDRVLARGVRIRPSSMGLVSLTVPRDLLGPGRNHLEVFGERRGEREPIAEFVVNLAP